jgi:putative ABC transport system ATP-binding protein
MYPGMPYPYPPGAMPPGAMPPGAMPPGAMPPGAMPPGSGAYPAAYPAAPAAPASNPVMPIPIHRPVEQPPVVVGPSATSSSSEVLITLQDVVKQFERGGEKLTILENLNIKIRRGSFDALMGPSGSGKSTLLNIIAGLDRPTSGIVEVGGVRMDQMGEGRLAKWRADNIGFVYQQYNLIPVMTAIENVELPLLLTKVKKSERRQRARTALRIVGLEDRMGHFPRQLSGGQEQRVAIARAIVNDPAIIVADEPTGDLDRQAADDILLVLEKLARELGKTIVMVTHDPAASARAFVQHRLDKGRIIPR